MAPRLGTPVLSFRSGGDGCSGRARLSQAGQALGEEPRQNCGRLGKERNCQGGMFNWAGVWTPGTARPRVHLRPGLEGSGMPLRTGGRSFQRRTVGPGLCWSGSWSWGIILRAEWVARRRLGCQPTCQGGTGECPGDALRAGRSGRHYGLALGPGLDQSGIARRDVRPPPANPSCGLGSGGPWSSA